MWETRRLCSGSLKCETLVLLESWRRTVRDSHRFKRRGVAKCETLVVFVSVESRNARRSSLLES